MPMLTRHAVIASLSVLALGMTTAAVQQPVELGGQVAFDVGSASGLVRSVQVTIGDGGTGSHQAVLVGDPSLPTHAIYRPRDLSPFGPTDRLPIVAWANGGCRNSSGEFRNFLSEVASHGFLVVAIGPAAYAAVMGSEAPTGTSDASQLLDGIEWAIAQNVRSGGEYFERIDASAIAVMGQSCGGVQALDVSRDPRVTTSVIWNSGVLRGLITDPAGRPAAIAGIPGEVIASMAPMINRMTPERLRELHGPVMYVAGGPTDIAYAPAAADFERIDRVPVLLANRAVGHYPATYREPNGGAFTWIAVAWLSWQLKHDEAAARLFVGEQCGLCRDPSWAIQRKNLR